MGMPIIMRKSVGRCSASDRSDRAPPSMLSTSRLVMAAEGFVSLVLVRGAMSTPRVSCALRRESPRGELGVGGDGGAAERAHHLKRLRVRVCHVCHPHLTGRALAKVMIYDDLTQ